MQSLFDWLSNPSFQALALSLLASLWQAALVFLVIYLLLRLNKNAPARIKYNIAALGQLIIAGWFIQTFLHHLSMQSSLTGALTEHEAAVLFYPGRLPLLSGLYTEDTATAGVSMGRVIPLASGLYIIGVLMMAIRLLYAYSQTKMLKTKGLFMVPTNYLAHLDQACLQFDLSNNIRLYLSNRVNVPVMMGFFKPIILLPVSIITHLTTAQIEAIITHELAHIKRHDYLINIIQNIIEAIFFYNPFVWLLSRIMREQREKACDDLVTKEVSAYTYATALLALEQINGTKRLTLAANGHKSYRLLNRIKLFTMKQNPMMSIKQKALSLLLIIIGLGCIAWLSPEQGNKKEKQAANTSKLIHFSSNVDQSLSSLTFTKDPLPMEQEVKKENRNDDAPFYKDSLTPQLQNQIEEITRSAQQIAAQVQKDTSWKKSVRALQLNAQKIAIKFEQDTAWKKALLRLTEDAKNMSHKMQQDPTLKKQMQDLEKRAHEMSEDHKPSPEMQKQLEDLRDRSLDIALQFKNDTAWKKQLKTIQFKAKEIARQMKENPEMAKKIKEMAERSKDIAFKVLNDPKFKLQLEQLRIDLQKMKFNDKDNE